jgi:hypothetical protein
MLSFFSLVASQTRNMSIPVFFKFTDESSETTVDETQSL